MHFWQDGNFAQWEAVRHNELGPKTYFPRKWGDLFLATLYTLGLMLTKCQLYTILGVKITRSLILLAYYSKRSTSHVPIYLPMIQMLDTSIFPCVHQVIVPFLLSFHLPSLLYRFFFVGNYTVEAWRATVM